MNRVFRTSEKFAGSYFFFLTLSIILSVTIIILVKWIFVRYTISKMSNDNTISNFEDTIADLSVIIKLKKKKL